MNPTTKGILILGIFQASIIACILLVLPKYFGSIATPAPVARAPVVKKESLPWQRDAAHCAFYLGMTDEGRKMSHTQRKKWCESMQR